MNKINFLYNSINKKKMYVICLEGCHGSGKTKLCKQFSKNDFKVLDEAFIDMPEFSLHPQCLS